MPLHIDYDLAAAVLSESVAGKPEGYVYEKVVPALGSCYYTHPDGSPGCIVGDLLDKLGAPRPEWNGGGNSGSAYTLFDLYLSDAVSIDRDALNLLADVQSRQDNGYTWEEAVAWGVESSRPALEVAA